jgi:phosphonate transport system substrate-binding protein
MRSGSSIRARARTTSTGARLLGAVALFSLSLAGGPAAAAETLDMGTISESPSKMIKRYTPLTKYLTGKSLPMGKINNAHSVEEMIDLINTAKVDFMFESPYGAVQIMMKTDADPVLIYEKDGIRQYNSVLFVKSTSSIKELGGLTGKVVAFEDPGSTSGYILPKNLLTQAGLRLVEGTKPVPGAVAYYFANGDANVLAHVKLGRAEAGGLDKEAVARSSAYRILAPESGYVPRQVLLVRDGVDSGPLKQALLRMGGDPDAAEAMESLETTTGFSEFAGDPRAVMNQVRAELGL